MMDPTNFVDTMLMNKLIITEKKPKDKKDKKLDKSSTTKEFAQIRPMMNNSYTEGNIVVNTDSNLDNIENNIDD